MRLINKFRDRIANGGQCFGIYVTIADSCISEMAGMAGYDFVWICTEHTAFDKKEIFQHVLAAQSAGAAAFVRMKGVDPTDVKAMLDMGADGILFPMVESAEQAERAVKACMFPPEGMRGGGPIRALRYGIDNEPEYLAKANKDIWKVIIIETEEGYKHLDEIMEVKGIDSIFIGAGDLRLSLSRLPEPERSITTDKYVVDIANRLNAKGIVSGTGSSAKVEDIAKHVSRGFSWFFVSQDARLISVPMVENLKKLREVFK
jgi:2-keto-3-deoxy-L-rhamnonate aldolase RhmA